MTLSVCLFLSRFFIAIGFQQNTSIESIDPKQITAHSTEYS